MLVRRVVHYCARTFIHMPLNNMILYLSHVPRNTSLRYGGGGVAATDDVDNIVGDGIGGGDDDGDVVVAMLIW